MRGGDSEQELTQTSVTITKEQKDWIDSQPINFSALVRDFVEEARQRDDIDSAAVLEAVFVERGLLESRCETYERILDEEELFKCIYL